MLLACPCPSISKKTGKLAAYPTSQTFNPFGTIGRLVSRTPVA